MQQYADICLPHGFMSVIFIDDKQAKDIYHYKNIKRKLYR